MRVRRVARQQALQLGRCGQGGLAVRAHGLNLNEHRLKSSWPWAALAAGLLKNHAGLHVKPAQELGHAQAFTAGALQLCDVYY